jgi:tetratricopeptide (TPR) repeat protein
VRDLKARLRDIVRQDGRPRVPSSSPKPHQTGGRPELTYVPDPDRFEGPGGLLAGLGAERRGSNGSCLVVDHLFAGDRSHGRRRIESCAPSEDLPIRLFDPRVALGSEWWRHVVFFDIETTGLSGGAGTLAFLAGCGWFDEAGFRVRQFLLAGPAGEHAMLQSLAEVFEDASLLVTYNGRTFDVPFMDTRWAFHRAASPTGELAHFDMLPAARRLWRRRDETIDEAGCSLTALERSVLGVHRLNDVPGFDIPARYFYFLRTGDAACLDGVLEHNRYDLLSLAVIMWQALWLAREGPEACREPTEQMALGRLYERAGDKAAARRAFELASRSIAGDVRRQALVHLARALRRDARYEEAAAAWQQVLEMAPRNSASLSPLDRVAAEALAIHHEHRRKDLRAARRYAEALGQRAAGTLRRDVDKRLNRLDRKMRKDSGIGSLRFESDHAPIARSPKIDD